MYTAIEATFVALTVFVPTIIGLRARTNADWRSFEAGNQDAR